MPIDIQNLPGTGNNGEHRVYSNFFDDNSIIQQVCIVQPKNLIIDTLRKYFRNDNIYTYRSDQYGYPLTPNVTGMELDSTDTTKILISDVFRYEIKFFPSIVIKSGGGTYKPISFNQEGTIKYRKDLSEDLFGKQIVTQTPTHRVHAGAWDMNFDITIYSESHTEMEELVEIVTMILQYSAWNELRANGLFIKNISIGAENSEPYANDYIYNQTISISTFSEWRVEIPIDSIIEKLVFYFQFTRTPVAPNATITDFQELRFTDIVDSAEINLT